MRHDHTSKFLGRFFNKLLKILSSMDGITHIHIRALFNFECPAFCKTKRQCFIETLLFLQIVGTGALDGGIAQLGEHLPCKQGVMSSNLIISTTFEK